MSIEDGSASHVLENYFDSLLFDEEESKSSKGQAELESSLPEAKISAEQLTFDKKIKAKNAVTIEPDKPIRKTLLAAPSLDSQMQTKNEKTEDNPIGNSEEMLSRSKLKQTADLKPAEALSIKTQNDAVKGKILENKELSNSALSNSVVRDNASTENKPDVKRPNNTNFSKAKNLEDKLKYSPDAYLPKSKPKLHSLAYDDPDTHALEQEKKVRLQRLLDQQVKMEAEKAPVISPLAPPKIETPKIITAKIQDIETKPTAKLHDLPEEKTPSVEVFNDKPTSKLEILAWGENGRPKWAEKEFDVLLFDVCGLSLAVPLVALGQIFPYKHEKLSFLQGQSDWFMGILPTSLGDIRCINTALFVMPEKYSESFIKSANYVVTIDGFPWGLVVDNVKQPISLQPDEVNWRKHRSKRPWLAGTVKSHMCALIDIPQMAQILEFANRRTRD